MSKIKVAAVLVVFTIIIAAAFLFSGCGKTASDTQFINDAAENILISMNNSDYASFSKDFDDTMKVALNEASFPDFASAIIGSNGPYIIGSKKLVSVNDEQDENLIAASYLADFEIFEDLTFEITFKEIGNVKKVIGLWFSGPSTNIFIGTTFNDI